MTTTHRITSLRIRVASALAALLLAPLAHAAGPAGGGIGGHGGRPVGTPPVTTAPIAVPGTTIVIPAGTPFGTVVGTAPAVPGFPAAPITLQPNRTGGRPFGAP